MTEGSNGGPPDLPLNARTKLECIRSIVERADLTSPQKCIGVGIVLNAEKDWRAEVKTAQLQLYASVKDRETVFRATKALDDKAIVSKDSKPGQPGRFTVLPPRVVEAIIEAFNDLQSSRVEADRLSESGRVKPDGTSGLLPTGHAVGFEPTSQGKPVRSEPTASAPSRAPAPAQIDIKTLSKQEDNLLLPEQVAARGGDYDGDFPALNGTAFDLIGFIARHANVDEKEARRMLRSNIQVFGPDVLMEAYVSTMAEMAEGMVASPYKYLIGCARKGKDKPRKAAPKGEAGAAETRADRYARKLDRIGSEQSKGKIQ